MAINFKGLDKIIHAPARLQALVDLQIEGSLTFAELKKRIAVNQNSLALHLGRLEAASYITCDVAAQLPHCTYHLTSVGRDALASYLAAMQSIIDTVKRLKAD